MPDLSFLPRAEQRVAAMLIAAGLVFAGGFKVRDLIGDAKAAEARVSRLERKVARIDTNLVLLMHAARVTPAVDEDEPEPVSSGVGP